MGFPSQLLGNSYMFTGIVHGAFELVSVELKGEDYGQIGVALPLDQRTGLEVGASVSIDGVCLTVREIKSDCVLFDVVKSTLSRTIIELYEPGWLVNIERSVTMDGEIGGHEVSGHVDTCAVVESIERPPGNCCIFFRISPAFGKYMFPQGFIALNGVSLTVSDCLESGSLFSVWLIPETLERTNLSRLSIGMKVNLEIHRGLQVIVDTITDRVDRFLNEALKNGELSPKLMGDLLKLAGPQLPSATTDKENDE